MIFLTNIYTNTQDFKMKKIINGKLYNTETAELISEWDNGNFTSDFNFVGRKLWKKTTGEYFYTQKCGSGVGSDVRPLETMSDVLEWMEKYSEVEETLKLFPEITE